MREKEPQWWLEARPVASDMAALQIESGDAEFILDSDEGDFDKEWRVAQVPVDLILDNGVPPEPIRLQERLDTIRSFQSPLARPLYEMQADGRLKILDGWHRLQVSKERGETVVEALVSKPRGLQPILASGDGDARAAAHGLRVKNNFNSWFAGSKAIDEAGRPLKVFHGTSKKFDVFDALHSGKNFAVSRSHAFYFTNDKEYAAKYADVVSQFKTPGKPRVMEVYLVLRNPKEMAAGDRDPNEFIDLNKAMFEDAQNTGHDGIVVSSASGLKTLIAFHPDQIRQVTKTNALQASQYAKTQTKIDLLPTFTTHRKPSMVSDDGDMIGALYAEFDDDAHVRFGQDRKGNLRLQSIHASEAIRGRDMLDWLFTTYGRPIVVNEVTAEASGFWDRMQSEGRIASWSERRFLGATVPVAPADFSASRIDAARKATNFLEQLPKKVNLHV